MEPSVLIAALALGVSAIGFFYKLGRDTKERRENPEQGKLDQISDQLDTVLEKIDKIVDWQREATGIHEKHGEQIRTLFKQIDLINSRLEDRKIINQALQKILERLG